ncbi:hypothetical protein [Bradyrhizobium sp. SZCCHNS3002]|uniref:hypothetical protein n=1 Tax=Bradyrhizobium sp. SZCCHNS3002 TaxID=3057310 RepID=UPI0028E5787A|nr:hypothetical protein [Bradyrhizobium sp. SZCCHNS3002]
MSTAGQSDCIITHTPQTLGDFVRIVQHPAFRLGFLDARAGRALDHDLIMQRILNETPAGALKRLGWRNAGDQQPDMFRVEAAQAKRAAKQVETAQYRYEEGRILFIEYGVRCKAWGHPDFPPAEVLRFCQRRFDESVTTRTRGQHHGSADSTQQTEVRT